MGRPYDDLSNDGRLFSFCPSKNLCSNKPFDNIGKTSFWWHTGSLEKSPNGTFNESLNNAILENSLVDLTDHDLSS